MQNQTGHCIKFQGEQMKNKMTEYIVCRSSDLCGKAAKDCSHNKPHKKDDFVCHGHNGFCNHAQAWFDCTSMSITEYTVWRLTK